MNSITHALIPVITSSADKNGKNYWSGKKLAVLAVFGALPDILNPHLDLMARHTSWSHGMPAYLLISLFLLSCAHFKIFRLDYKLATWLSGAYAFHLVLDMISGGIPWTYPFEGSIIGGYYIPFPYWIYLDLILMLAVYFIHRAIPRFKAARNK